MKNLIIAIIIILGVISCTKEESIISIDEFESFDISNNSQYEYTPKDIINSFDYSKSYGGDEYIIHFITSDNNSYSITMIYINGRVRVEYLTINGIYSNHHDLDVEVFHYLYLN